jgi:Fe-S-cluster containining protein
MVTQQLVQIHGKNFFDKSEENPCIGCSAPCCRILLIPHPVPATFMDLDYIRYMVGFQSVKMVLNKDGTWHVLLEQNCRLLDQETNRCTAHNTARKPKTCVFFNPFRCWYKRNFTTSDPPDLIRIDMHAMEVILERVVFDDEGNIAEIPTWEMVRDMVKTSDVAQKNEAWFPVAGEPGANGAEAAAS